MRSAEDQLQTLLNSWNLTEEQVPRLCGNEPIGDTVYYGVYYQLRQRLDTKQYVEIEMRKSQSNFKDDYFYWKYVTIEDMVKYYLDRKRYQRPDDDLMG
jgi:hypothetical protein